MDNLRNVFDSKEEFEKLRGLILDGIQKFSDYRKGNMTYGEVMYVMECVLDSLRSSSEKQVKKPRGFNRDISFTTLFEITNRMVERMIKKGLVDSSDEKFILHGEE